MHRRAVTASQGKVEFGPRAVCDPGPIEGFLIAWILFQTCFGQHLRFVQRPNKFSFEIRAKRCVSLPKGLTPVDVGPVDKSPSLSISWSRIDSAK